MWFGNLVTMKWWDGLWFHESFSDCISIYALSKLELSYEISNPGIMQNIKKDLGYYDDEMMSSHPIEHFGIFLN